MIALSVYSNSPCIILDEPLSSVDYEDKHSIMKLLKEYSHDRVIILTIMMKNLMSIWISSI